jgi:hypothetical protein
MIIKHKILNKLKELKLMEEEFFHIMMKMDNKWAHIEYGLNKKIYQD